MNKKTIILGIAGVLLTVGIIISSIVLSGKPVKLSYELSVDDVPLGISYSTIKDNVGIQCGSVKIRLGQTIDISTFEVEDSVVNDNYTIKKVLSPSKKYELIVVGKGSLHYVQEIRTTVPTVYNLDGYKIGDDYKDIKKLVDIPKRKKVVYNKTKNTETRLEFISGYLVVIDCRCVKD